MHRRLVGGFLLLLLLLAGAWVWRAEARDHELVVYSGRREALIEPVVQAFERQSRIRVVLRSGGASELANAILEEGARPRADVFIANDAGTLEMLRLRGRLAPNPSPAVMHVPSDLRAADGSWVGVSARVRVIMYNTGLLSENEVPRSVLELADPRWRGQVALANSSNESWIAQITALRLTLGDVETERFLRALAGNGITAMNGHTPVRQAVGRGEFPLGLVNHYYYHLEKEAGSPVAVVYPDQGDGRLGALVNVAGAAIVQGARNAAAARAFVDYLLSPEAQGLFARLNHEIPTLPGVEAGDAPPLDAFQRMPVPLEELGRQLEATLNLIERVGLP